MSDSTDFIRKYKRYRSSFPAHYRIQTASESSSSATLLSFPFIGIAGDISCEGMLLLTFTRLKRENFLDLCISLPFKEKTERVILKGNVCWSRNKYSDEFQESRFKDYNFCAGILFLNSPHLRKLKEFIDYWKTVAS